MQRHRQEAIARGKERFRAGYDGIFGPTPARLCNGTYVVRDGQLVPGHARRCDSKHFVSESLGCAEGQVAEFNREFGDDGVKFDPQGRAVFDDRQAKLKHMRRRGYFDHDEVRGGRPV